jgi:hypothetical protein
VISRRRSRASSPASRACSATREPCVVALPGRALVRGVADAPGRDTKTVDKRFSA